MCRWALRFFGLTSLTKDQLYLEEIWQLIKGYEGSAGTYWDIYNMPIFVRKWFLNRELEHRDQIKKKNPKTNTDRPLTPMQKRQMQLENQKVQNQPMKPFNPADFMTPRRNK